MLFVKFEKWAMLVFVLTLVSITVYVAEGTIIWQSEVAIFLMLQKLKPMHIKKIKNKKNKTHNRLSW